MKKGQGGGKRSDGIMIRINKAQWLRNDAAYSQFTLTLSLFSPHFYSSPFPPPRPLLPPPPPPVQPLCCIHHTTTPPRHRNTALPHHRTTALLHHRTTAPSHHRTTALPHAPPPVLLDLHNVGVRVVNSFHSIVFPHVGVVRNPFLPQVTDRDGKGIELLKKRDL
jgi:hypothetical protein